MNLFKNYLKFLIPISIITFAVYSFYQSDKEKKELLELLNETYTKIKYEDNIENIILKIYYPSEWRGKEYFQYITFKNKEKYSFKINKTLFNDTIYFNQVLKNGTLLKKNKNSDTLYVINDSLIHRFILNYN